MDDQAEDEMGGACSTNGQTRNAYRLLVGKPGDNIKMDLGGRRGWCRMDWSGSGKGQVERSCEFGIEPSGSTNCWETRVASELVTAGDVLSSIDLVILV
jgi:hypothetical protein